MVRPPAFRDDRAKAMRASIRGHPFAMVVCAVIGALAADHVPLVPHEDEGE